VASMAFKNTDDPFITGTGAPYTDPTQKALEDIATPPMSIKPFWTDKWYSYRRLDPFASALAFTIDLADAFSRGVRGQDPWDNFARLSLNMANSMNDKTYLKTVGDLIKAVQNPHVQGPQFVSNILTGFNPTLFRHAGLAADPYLRQTRPITNKDRFLNRPLQRAFPFGGPVDRPAIKIGPLGEELKKPEGLYPTTDWLFRMINPMQSTVGTNKSIYRMLLNWNEFNPNDEYYLSIPEPRITHNGEEYEMSDAQYEQYMRMRGEYIMKMWNNYERFSTPDYANPKKKNILALKKMVGKAQKATRAKMLKELIRSK